MLPHFLARSLQRLVNGLGYAVVRTDASQLTMESALKGIVRRNDSVKTVIDVGASDGN